MNPIASTPNTIMEAAGCYARSLNVRIESFLDPDRTQTILDIRDPSGEWRIQRAIDERKIAHAIHPVGMVKAEVDFALDFVARDAAADTIEKWIERGAEETPDDLRRTAPPVNERMLRIDGANVSRFMEWADAFGGAPGLAPERRRAPRVWDSWTS